MSDDGVTHRRFRLFDNQRATRGSFDRLDDENYYDNDNEATTIGNNTIINTHNNDNNNEPIFDASHIDIEVAEEAGERERGHRDELHRHGNGNGNDNKTEEEKDLDELIDLNLDDNDLNNSELDLRSHNEGEGDRSSSDRQSLMSHFRRSVSMALQRINPSKALPTQTISEQSLPSAASHILAMLAPATRRGTLSTFMGVFIQCIIGTFGVIIFLRMGWIVGQAGFVHSLMMFLLSYMVVALSLLSVAAISSNGKMEGGGAYFLISRSLGPEFGGSIGILFYGGSLLAAAFYLLGFAESLVGTFDVPDTRWMKFMYCSVALIILSIITWTGPKFVSRLSLIIFFILCFCIFFAWLGFLVSKPGKVPGYTGPSMATMRRNMWPAVYYSPDHDHNMTDASEFPMTDYDVDSYSFQKLFGVLFPATTGVVAGVNMSGDLAAPEVSIPKGTLLATLCAFLTYISLLLAMVASVDHSALIADKLIMLSVSPAGGIISLGIFVAVLSSALSSLITGSRILQAIAADQLIPFFKPFAALDETTNEPRRALIMTYFMAQLFLLVPKLEKIATVITIFYLLVFLFTNFACFLLSILSAPNFRPIFRYYHWGGALLGSFLCAGTMFFVDPGIAGISISMLVVMFFYIHFRSPVVSWGYISQALMFQQVRKYLLMLDVRKLQHVKFWRPQVLFLVSNPRSSLQLLHFVNKLQQGGLYVTGHVVVGSFESRINHANELINHWLRFAEDIQIEAFPEVVIAPSVRAGAQSLLLTSGISGMKPNTVILGFYDMYLAPHPSLPPTAEIGETLELFPPLRDSNQRHDHSPEDYVALLRDVILSGKNLIIARHFEKLVDPNHPLRQEVEVNEELVRYTELWLPWFTKFKFWKKLKEIYRRENNFIDVWPLAHTHTDEVDATSTFSITLLLGYILAKSRIWSRLRLRVLSFVEDSSCIASEEEKLAKLLMTSRIGAHETKVVALDSMELSSYKTKQEQIAMSRSSSNPFIFQQVTSTERAQIINELLRRESSSAAAIFFPIDMPPTENTINYLEELDILSAGLPPMLLCRGVTTVITTEM